MRVRQDICVRKWEGMRLGMAWHCCIVVAGWVSEHKGQNGPVVITRWMRGGGWMGEGATLPLLRHHCILLPVTPGRLPISLQISRHG